MGKSKGESAGRGARAVARQRERLRTDPAYAERYVYSWVRLGRDAWTSRTALLESTALRSAAALDRAVGSLLRKGLIEVERVKPPAGGRVGTWYRSVPAAGGRPYAPKVGTRRQRAARVEAVRRGRERLAEDPGYAAGVLRRHLAGRGWVTRKHLYERYNFKRAGVLDAAAAVLLASGELEVQVRPCARRSGAGGRPGTYYRLRPEGVAGE